MYQRAMTYREEQEAKRDNAWRELQEYFPDHAQKFRDAGLLRPKDGPKMEHSVASLQLVHGLTQDEAKAFKSLRRQFLKSGSILLP